MSSRIVLLRSLRLLLVAIAIASVRCQLWSWEIADAGQRGRESGLFFAVMAIVSLLATFRRRRSSPRSRSDRIMAAARRAHRTGPADRRALAIRVAAIAGAVIAGSALIAAVLVGW